MDQPALPLNYYCRSARLALKKADFAKKAGAFVDELQQLKKFESLLLSTIPRHPNYHLNRGESQIADLQIILVDVEKRIRALESDMHGRISPYSGRRTTSKLKPGPRSSVKPPRPSRLGSEVVKSPKKARKSVKKATTKKRDTWEDWSSRLSEVPRKRSVSPLSRKSPSRKSKSPSRSPARRSSAGSKYWEVPPARRSCANCSHDRDRDLDRDQETERGERWRFSSFDGSGTDRLRDLSRKLLATSSRHRDRDSSGSPISRALQPLEDDFINLQALVIELKGSLDGFKLRFDEEGRMWRSRTDNLEKDLQYLRHDMEVDMLSIKRSIQDEVKRTLDGLTNDLAAAEDLWALSEAQKKEKLQHVRDESSAMMEDFREKMNFSFVETKSLLLKTVDEKIANTLGGIKSGLRSDFEILEMGIARDVDDLRREMTLRSESFLTEVELAGIGGKQRVESLIKEALEKFLPEKLDSMMGKERTVTEMKEALCLLWKEVEALSKSKRGVERAEREIRRDDFEEARRGPIRQAIERCFPAKPESSIDTKERSISEVKDELRTLWSEVDSLSGKGRKEGVADMSEVHEDSEQVKKQLQFVRKEAMQARVDADDMRKECTTLRRSIGDLEFKLRHIEGLPQLLDNIEEAKSKMDTAMSCIEKEKNLAITAATDAASAASKAGQMVEDVIGSVSSEKLNARRKSCEFQESLAMEKDIVAESAGAVLTEVRRKSLHLQESLEQDICKVKESFSTEVRRMSMDLNQERECAASEVRQFQQSLKDAFAALEKERDAASSAASEITALAEKAEGLIARINKTKPGAAELKGTAFETALDYKGNDETSVRNLMILEARIKHTAGEQLNLSKKVHKLEIVHATVSRTVEDLRSGACGMEKSAASLVPRFESAAAVLSDVEKRVGILENPPGRKRKKVRSPMLGKGTMSVDAKVILLENRIDHVASATYTNLRILDTKVEKLSTGVQSALDGATATENKCSALGEEVVRVFRMFLTARKPKDQPEKNTAIPAVGTRRRPQRWDTSGPGAIQSRCICCSTGNRWTAPGELGHHKNPKCPQHPDNINNSKNRGEVRKINVRLGPELCAVRSESPLHCTIQTAPPAKQPRSESPVHCVIRTSSPVKQHSQNSAGLLQMLESEVAQVVEEESFQDGSDEQNGPANFQLESGRIHLNVRG